MGDFLRAWWPVLLLVYLPSLVTTFAGIWLLRAFRRLDESHEDDLPYIAGEWLQREITRLELDGWLKAIVTDNDAKASIDAYHPTHGVIQLTAQTHFKRDPMHWAIAAHELGHGRFRLGWPLLTRLMMSAAYVKRAITAVALGLALGNIVYAQPGITELAFILFCISCVLHQFVLLDEAVASLLAMRSLRATEGFGPSHLRSARKTLIFAFTTYLIAFAARALLLTQWHLVEELSRVPNVPPLAQLTTLGMIVAVVASIVVVLYGVSRVALILWPERLQKHDLDRHGLRFNLLFHLALVGLVLLVWNHRADADYAYAVMAAVIPIASVFVMLLSLPMIVLDVVLLRRFAKRMIVDPTHMTHEYRRDHLAGSKQRGQGNLAFEELLVTAQTTALFEQRLDYLMRLCYIPLVVVFWLS